LGDSTIGKPMAVLLLRIERATKLGRRVPELGRLWPKPLNILTVSSEVVSRLALVFDFIPQPLRDRLGEEPADMLGAVVGIVEASLRQVYEMDSSAYDPSVGDNSQLFGQNIWHHGWFAIEEALDGFDAVLVNHEDNSHRIHLGKLTIAVYKGGKDEVDRIDDVNLNGSATKRNHVARNQLQLFSLEEFMRPVAERAYELNTLWIVHFGNPREQLVKLYLGAPTRNAEDRTEWAWYRRVDKGGAAETIAPPLPEMSPSFDEQPEPEIRLELEEDVEEARGPDGE